MSTIWIFDEKLGGEFLIRPATLGDFKRKNEIIFIKDATLEDIPAMRVAEKKAWPKKEAQATEEQMISRIKIFPEGTKIAVKGKDILGIASMQFMDYPWKIHFNTHYECTDNGLIRSHDPMGETICGVNLGVIPEAPKGIGAALMQAHIAMAIKKGVRYGMGISRLPLFSKYADKMTVEEYVFTKTKEGRYLDPEIDFYINKVGLEIVKISPNYYKDPESCDYQVVVRWKNPLLPYYFESHFNHSSGKTESFLNFAILTGCYWAKKIGGRCTNCGFQVGIDEFWRVAESLDINLNDFIGIFDRALLHLNDATNIVFYTGGSFFEIPDYIITPIFWRLNKIGQIKEVLIETRPEFVTSENIRKLRTLARSDLVLKIAIGLESVDDEVREKKINKGFSKESYIQAVKLIREEGMIPCTYVLLKPLGLSEKEAIEDVVKTIEWSRSIGSELTLLQATFVQDNTPLAKAYKEGSYRPPWLWSVIHVLSKFSKKFPISLGRFEDYPPPIAKPQNCGKCDENINKALAEYRITNLLPAHLPYCECYREWQTETGM